MIRKTALRCVVPCLAVIVGSMWASPVHGEPDLVGTRALGMGGALRAPAAGTDAILLNPAGLAQARMYALRALYQFRSSDSAHMINASIADSVTTSIAVGLFYNFKTSSPTFHLATAAQPVKIDAKTTAHEGGLALAADIARRVMIGATVKYLNNRADFGELPTDGLDPLDVNNFTVDSGLTIRITDSIQLASVGYNLIPVHDTAYPIALGLGGSVAFNPATLVFDSVLDFTSDPDGITASLHGGAEVFFDNMYVLRAGASHRFLGNRTYFSGGAAIVTPKVGLEFSLRQQVVNGPETLFAATIQAYLN